MKSPRRNNKSCLHKRNWFAVVYLVFSLAWVPDCWSQLLTWQALPFPQNSDWPGPQGQLATISPNQVILQGQPVRSLETFSGPVTFSCDATLQSKSSPDGALVIFFTPVGQPTNLDLTQAIALQLGYDTTSQDTMAIINRQGSTPDAVLWSTSYPLSAATDYHVTLGVGADGALSLNVNGTPYALPASSNLPFSQFQIQMEGWQPTDTWTVSNFAVVPEPSVPTLAALSAMGLAWRKIRRRSIGDNPASGSLSYNQ